jgi:catechol 2,3-dioxygenase-like lactoylglutathione lyase family enzyme
MIKVTGLDHVAINAKDVMRSMAWYRDVLGLERRHEDAWGDMPIMMCAGNTCVAIFPLTDSQPAAASGPRVLHIAFRADRATFEQAQRDLQKHGIDFEFQDHGIAYSIYFRDPDGHKLEITTYEV